MRNLIIILLVFLPWMLIAQTAILPFAAQNGQTTQYRDGQRVLLPGSIETGDWDFDDFNYERDFKSEYVYSIDHPTVPIQINGYVGSSHQVFEWLPKSNFVYTYNAAFTRIMQVIYNASIDDAPIQPIYRYTYQYDNQDRLTQIFADAYDNVALTWTPSQRLYSTYTDNYLTQTVEWINYGSTVNYDRYNYEYDTNGKLTTRNKSNSQDSTGWWPAGQRQYVYHANDTSTNDGFMNYYSTMYAFTYPLIHNQVYGFSNDYYGRVSLITDGFTFGSNFMPSNRYTYTYDNYNHLTEALTELYTSSWGNWSMFTLSYNVDSNLQYQTFLSWDNSVNGWENMRRITYGWVYDTANDDQTIPAISDLNLREYPNPFQDHFQVRTDAKTTEPITLRLYNIKGQCVQEMKSLPNQATTIDSSLLPNGIYLLKATQGQITETVKLIRVK